MRLKGREQQGRERRPESGRNVGRNSSSLIQRDRLGESERDRERNSEREREREREREGGRRGYLTGRLTGHPSTTLTLQGQATKG